MKSAVCNIGLNRRRDLTLRQDLCLRTSKGKHMLAELFKGKLAVLFGVPDMGKVCSEQHVPNYIKNASELKKAGVNSIFCVAVGDPKDVESWGDKLHLRQKEIEVLSDKNGGFAKLLGVDLAPPEAQGPHTQRYVALIEDGILLKLKVEESLKDVKVSSAESILETLKYLQSLN